MINLPYTITPEDIEALVRLQKKGGTISFGTVDFEAGIINPDPHSLLPLAYGNGLTIVDAINEAIGKPKKKGA